MAGFTAVVTCEQCRHRQVMARRLQGPATFSCICHGCESVLKVNLGLAGG